MKGVIDMYSRRVCKTARTVFLEELGKRQVQCALAYSDVEVIG